MYNLTRQIPVEEQYDIAVCGGGPAGTAAAVCAARRGAKVLLIEATGCLGGMGTSGLVCAFDPMADGERQLAAGFIGEVVETMYEKGFLMPNINPDCWRKNFHVWTPFHPEGLKIVLDEKVTQAGVDVRFFTKLIDADCTDNTINGIVIHNIEGYSYIKAKKYIDCTGDAILSDLCGVECREAGVDTENIMPATLTSLHANIEWDRLDQMAHDDRKILIEKAYADGILTQCDRHMPGMSKIGDTLGYLNGGHVFGLNALKCKDLTDGMMLGRKIAQEYLHMFRKYCNAEKMELVATGALMGVRESRRIVGEYELNFDDFINRQQFDDQIGVFNKFIDIHAYDCSLEEYTRFIGDKHKYILNPGECFGIPYRILVPKNSDNLWVAGRCVSTDVAMQGCIRVMPSAAIMGEAAGVAAVQSIKTGQKASALDTKALVEVLKENNVCVD